MVRIPTVAALVLVAGLAGCVRAAAVQRPWSRRSRKLLARQRRAAAQPRPPLVARRPGHRRAKPYFKAQDIRPTVCALPNGTFLKAGTENDPLKLKSVTVKFLGAHSATSVSDSSGAASATASGTFESSRYW